MEYLKKKNCTKRIPVSCFCLPIIELSSTPTKLSDATVKGISNYTQS